MPAAFLLEGTSMLPVFRPGEVVIILPLDAKARASRLAPGDCAVYAYQGCTLLHRVIRVVPEGAWLSDDAGRLEPHLAPWADIKGLPLSRHPLSAGLPGLLYSRIRRSISFLFV